MSDALATQVARLFFDRQLSKVEIGQRLGISRFRVARLLERARETGLVRIEYRDVAERDRGLARDLETRYGIDLCAVATEREGGPGAVLALAAEVLAEVLEDDETLGVAWGSTLAGVLEHLPWRRHAGLRVVPLAGGSGRLQPDRGPAELARRFAERLGGVHRELFAPAFVATPELRRALVDEPEVAAVVAAWEQLTTAVVGIGAWGDGGDAASSSLLASGALSSADLARLRSMGAVGELVVHPLDRAGRFVWPELADRAVAIPVELLRATPRLIAVAAGEAKAVAIRAALLAGVIDVLVTDAAAATALCGGDGA